MAWAISKPLLEDKSNLMMGGVVVAALELEPFVCHHPWWRRKMSLLLLVYLLDLPVSTRLSVNSINTVE
jgi:hypothetical protein